MEALAKQNGVQLLGKFLKKFKKKLKTDLPYLSFYKRKPETRIFFFGLITPRAEILTSSRTEHKGKLSRCCVI
jgi:hypothetical protein